MADEDFQAADCVERARQGDEAAARDLVDHLYPLVRKIVRSHLPRRTDEEDLVQDIFVKLFVRLEQYRPRPGIPFTHWVSRLAVTTCLDALRAERRRPEWRWADLSEGEVQWLEFFQGNQPAAPVSDDVAVRELMEKLLQVLSPEDRLVIHLLDLEQRSVREISALTGWSGPLVKVRAFRARHRLRRHARQWEKGKTYE